MIIETLETPWNLARAAARHFVGRSLEAVAIRGEFTVALSGGSTPRSLYEVLADPDEPFRALVPWPNIHFFWSDERHVAPDHPDSNYRMAYEAMLSHVPVSGNNVHRILGENTDAVAVARAYEQTLVEVTKANLPQLDLILLGLGTDGHTASIFPGSEVLHEPKHLVAAPWVEPLKTHRITMTLPLLNNAASVLFLVNGVEKAEIVKEVLQGSKRYPAQEVKPASGELLWMLDKDAASMLREPN
jgi:6-phosphogluconolactonase